MAAADSSLCAQLLLRRADLEVPLAIRLEPLRARASLSANAVPARRLSLVGARPATLSECRLEPLFLGAWRLVHIRLSRPLLALRFRTFKLLLLAP